MFNWKDRVYVNARKKIFKNLDTNEMLNLEIQEDEGNILEESETPLTAYCLNQAQQELVEDISKIYNKAISEVNENLDNIEAELRNVTTYSTEEQVIGKWIDGKTIYRKVISGNMPVPDINGGTWYNITNNVQDLVNVYGNILQRPYNYVTILRNNAYVSAFDIVVDSNILKYRNLGIPADQSYKIILEYTKTTD